MGDLVIDGVERRYFHKVRGSKRLTITAVGESTTGRPTYFVIGPGIIGCLEWYQDCLWLLEDVICMGCRDHPPRSKDTGDDWPPEGWKRTDAMWCPACVAKGLA